MEDDTSAGRSNKGDDMTEPPVIQSLDHRHTPASEPAQTGRCARSVSPQQARTERDSDVSDDTDQDLDIEDDGEFTLKP